MADRSSFAVRTPKFVVVTVSLLIIGSTILSRPDWKLRDFDQVFYVTIAYDLDRYGIYSDGIFDPVAGPVRYVLRSRLSGDGARGNETRSPLSDFAAR